MKSLPLISCCAPLASELSDGEADELESLFAALADKSRVRIVSTLLRARDACCVCDLELELSVGQPTVSYHLKKLTDVGLLERERRGTYAYYRVAPEALDRMRGLFA